MFITRRTRSLLAAVACGLVVGCSAAIAPSGVEVVVGRPPAVRHEVRGAAPGTGYVWVQGHYAWQGGSYVWIGGRWERPPEARLRRWQPGHWQRVRGGWIWVDGRWQ